MKMHCNILFVTCTNVKKETNIDFLTNNIQGTNFVAPHAYFDNQCLFGDARCQNI